MVWLLPGAPPAGRRVAFPMAAVVQFRGGRVARDHIDWDQASVLVQAGLLDRALPERGGETAAQVLNPTQPTDRPRHGQRPVMRRRQARTPYVVTAPRGPSPERLVRLPGISSGGIVRSPGIPGPPLMPQDAPGRGRPIGPLDWLRIVPFEAAASSGRLGWVGLEAARYRAERAAELDQPALTHHWLILHARPPEELDLLYDGVDRHAPPPAGSVVLVPAGSPVRWRCRGRRDLLNIHLDVGLVGRVAAEAFGLDTARLALPPLDGLDLPPLRAAMLAVGAELAGGGAGGPLAAESLANLLAVHLLRQVAAPRRLPHGRDGALPRARLRAVVEYVEEHLDASPTLEQMAAVARLSVYHFARQFRAATGRPPHQYVIARRVERARQHLEAGTDLSLAEVAGRAGFSDQSQFARHFKRHVGVTPGRFRRSARIAEKGASRFKNPGRGPSTIRS
jgi:AraC family transcriptional regulator